jgi:hypothetical protein
LAGSSYVESVPFRFASMHICYNFLQLRPLLSLVQMAVGKEGRLRFRSHYGMFLM